MKKIVMLGALLVLSPVFAFASANKLEPYTVVPVVKNDKDHHDQKAHDTAHAKHPQKTKEEYIKELQTKIDETKKIIENKKNAVPAPQYELALMKISFAEQWLKTIESYKDPITRYVRSFKYGISELDSAKSDVKIKKKNAKQISPDEMAGKLQSLSKQASLLKSEKEGIIFHEENQACYDKMNELAQEYAKLAGKPEYKDNFKNLSRHAGKYLSDAKKFLNAHKPHAHKHGHKHKVGHNETNKLLYTDSSNIAATTSTQSAPLTTVAK